MRRKLMKARNQKKNALALKDFKTRIESSLEKRRKKRLLNAIKRSQSMKPPSSSYATEINIPRSTTPYSYSNPVNLSVKKTSSFSSCCTLL